MRKQGMIVAGLLAMACVPALAQRTNVARDMPLYDNGGKPDLAIDGQRFVSQMEIVDRYFSEGECALVEGVVGGTGYRRLLRFDTVILNRSKSDLVIGNRADSSNPYADWFYFDNCHGHYHLRDFSVYELIDANGNLAAKGTKQGFCMEDSFKYDSNKSNGYNCEYQGITSGWGDWYYKQLVGQWIDITGVPAGEYTVRVRINFAKLRGRVMVDEGENRYPNEVSVKIQIPDPRNKVAVVTD